MEDIIRMLNAIAALAVLGFVALVGLFGWGLCALIRWIF